MNAYIHPTALIEDGVEIGHDTSVWDSVHIRRNTCIGHHCIIGEKTHISYGVRIGDLVKVNAFVYICTAVTLEDGVMVSAGCIFTNDRYPRATEPELMSLRSSDPDEKTYPTLVRAGATIGAGSIIGCNLSIGRFAMVGMGSLVTRPIDDFHLVMGNPARVVGYVCRCGQPFTKFEPNHHPERIIHSCPVCRRRYTTRNGVVTESFAAIR
jgi:UDP-2-acetamido-3-amino-2,3-dideoxy-glucuronate N-acetyltransferase